MEKTVKIVGTNNLFKDLQDSEFILEKILTNKSQVHMISLKNFPDQIFFDPNCKISFIEEGIWIEGFAQVKDSLGNLSIVIK